MRPALVVCLLAALTGVACEHRPRITVKKERVLVLPQPWRRPSINVADDGTHATYSVRDESRYYVVTPKGRGPTFDDVGGPLFAPKSDRVFYWGSHAKGDGFRFDVVADGVVVPTGLVTMRTIATTTGGTRWATRGLVDPADTPGADPASRMAVVVDGREAGRWASTSGPAFSPDGAHVAWAARSAAGETTIVVDGKVARTLAPSTLAEDPKFEELATVRYLSDGRLVAFVPDGDNWVVLRDGETLATYGQITIPGRTFIIGSPDTKASLVANSLSTAAEAPVAFWWERMAGAAEQWRVVRDGAPVDGMVCDHYWETLPWGATTDDGVHVAYVCPTAPQPDAPLGRRWVVLDGRRFGPYIETWTLGISTDGTQVAYGAAETLPIQSYRVLVNGTPRTPPEPLIWRPRFTPGGEHVLWAGGPERGRRRIGIDRHAITRFDDVVYGPEFPAARTAVWVIRRGRKLSRITLTY